MWLLLLSCAPVNTSDPEVDLFHEQAPRLLALDFDCDSENGVWSFRFRTSGWTGGGRLYISRDGTTVEQHKIQSVEADSDGSWDCLFEELEVSEDWTLAQSGTSTRWLCSDQDELGFLVQVDDPRREYVADCAVWGRNSDLWNSLEEIDECEEFLQPESQTTDTGGISGLGECNG